MRRRFVWVLIIAFLITGCVMFTSRVSEWTASTNNITIDQILTAAKGFAAKTGNEIKIADCRIGNCKKKVAAAVAFIMNKKENSDNKKVKHQMLVFVDGTKEKIVVLAIATVLSNNEEDRRKIQEESTNQFYSYLFQELNISDRTVVISKPPALLRDL
ncbi:MAG: hypothetical protein AABY58_05115 [Nitrospirota bacterium]